MLRTMLTSEIRRVTVTQADLHYVGSLTIDSDLMAAAGLLPGELVRVADLTNGARLETYAITGPAGSGVIGVNGAAAHLVHPGDVITIATYAALDDADSGVVAPRLVEVRAGNRLPPTSLTLRADPPPSRS
ncbi:aspartate 1-decarboxylase [Modestobacter sp. Leaf380]|uniref:aspartate 1-decarboxylase n=1 Tax=Modestobacter sp. Leaf380 TaxID=1736356 RepID=UPI000701CB91|nr:aspartate 1-decarboxylase [Modestobacter sp. Leaf380]KQS71313.1 hypothetical protein ASG41_20115 [Modestobacter sp. Leaf380]